MTMTSRNTSNKLVKALNDAKNNYQQGFITREEYLDVQRKINRLATFGK